MIKCKECSKHGMYIYRNAKGVPENYCFTHIPRPQKKQKENKEKQDLEFSEDKTRALYYDS